MKKSKEEKQFELIIQLHGGGNPLKKAEKAVRKTFKKAVGSGLSLLTGGRAEGSDTQAAAAQAAPTMSAAAAIESATEDSVQDVKNRLRKAKGKNYTNQTAGSTMDSMKKSLLGE